MNNVHNSILAVLIFLFGCAPVQYASLKPTVQHQYEITVVDLDGNPLQGVQIDYELKDNKRVVKSASYITKTDGKLSESLFAIPFPIHTKFYKSEFNYKASKHGYYSKSGKLFKYQTDNESTSVKKETITLKGQIDYFNKEFASTLSDIKLKTRILNFIDLVILQGLVTESILEMHSVNLVPFKGNSYLQFKFTNNDVYNSLNLDKYDVGKRLFDEVVRKILSPLNEYIFESNLFYGYDLIVVGYTKSFIDEDETPKPIEYRFLIPEKVVRAYKNMDISGQKVLDASVILMDDERIKLKLQ